MLNITSSDLLQGRWHRAGSELSVVGEAQGDQSSLDKFVQHLNSGPQAAEVTGVEQKDINTKSGEKGFDRANAHRTSTITLQCHMATITKHHDESFSLVHLFDFLEVLSHHAAPHIRAPDKKVGVLPLSLLIQNKTSAFQLHQSFINTFPSELSCLSTLSILSINTNQPEKDQMNCTRAQLSSNLISKQGVALVKSLNGQVNLNCVKATQIGLQHHIYHGAPTLRHFSTSKPAYVREFFPEPESPSIRTTKAAWEHPVYTRQQMEDVRVAHRQAKDWSDFVALSFLRVLRWGTDVATGYKKDPKISEGGKPISNMTERKWLIRCVSLESVAGVPGMVAGMLRHLHSMRRMKRDNGWIETLLEASRYLMSTHSNNDN
nr:alternative oxidase, mitochondrial [Quercus suber]